MESVREILRDADPLRHDPPRLEVERDRVRRAVLAAASETAPRSSMRWRMNRTPAALLAAVAVIVLCVAVLGSKIWSGGSATLHAAAVRFELRLADTAFSPGLREARVAVKGIVLHRIRMPFAIRSASAFVQSQLITADVLMGARSRGAVITSPSMSIAMSSPTWRAVVRRIFSAPAALNVTATPNRDGLSPSITWLSEISSFVTMIS